MNEKHDEQPLDEVQDAIENHTGDGPGDLPVEKLPDGDFESFSEDNVEAEQEDDA